MDVEHFIAWNDRSPESAGLVEILVRAGMAAAGLIDRFGHTVESLCEASGGEREPWYFRTALAFWDEVERARREKRPSIVDRGLSMVEAQRACGLRDDKGVLLPPYSRFHYAAFMRLPEGGAA